MSVADLARIIDVHTHLRSGSPRLNSALGQVNAQVINIATALKSGLEWRNTVADYARLSREYPDLYSWCTTLQIPDLPDEEYVDRALAYLEADIRDGAIACKVWKNIGMEVKKPDDSFLLVDDPLFDPIFRELTRNGISLILHTGEPLACWLPLDQGSPHHSYYAEYPEWHMYGRSDVPSHEAQIAARDRVLERNPGLRVIGAHLGSLEYDLAELASRLERFPNFAVDTGARMLDLALHDSTAVREFFCRYAGRILFGTDLIVDSVFGVDETNEVVLRYERELAFYSSQVEFDVRGFAIRGLALPDSVLQKFLYQNALFWFPGIAASRSKHFAEVQ